MNLKNLFLNNNSKVLYIGASVTAQKEGFRPLFHGFLENYVGRSIEAHVNALGGVGSLFGLANLNGLCHQYKSISLAICEYSTGDLNLWITPKDILKDVIAEMFNRLCEISNNVIILHNYRSDFNEESGQVVRGVYDEVARINGLTVINMYKFIQDQLNIGSLRLNDIYRDNVHTTPIGSRVVAERLLFELANLNYGATSRYFSEKYNPMLFYDFSQCAPEEFRGNICYGSTEQTYNFICFGKHQQLDIMASGCIYGIVLIMGPESGILELSSLTGVIRLSAFDRNSYYNRPHCLPLRLKFNRYESFSIRASQDDPDFSILNKSHPKTAGPRVFRLCGFVGRNIKIKSLDIN